jgi:hypothetical protein
MSPFPPGAPPENAGPGRYLPVGDVLGIARTRRCGPVADAVGLSVVSWRVSCQSFMARIIRSARPVQSHAAHRHA